MIRKAIGRTERKDIVIYLPKYTIMYFRVYDTHTITKTTYLQIHIYILTKLKFKKCLPMRRYIVKNESGVSYLWKVYCKPC